ncbi:MAG: bacillithiol biosynthesis cysteine-adding enzyme BshC [candidate division NC10 bacterium]|nr:bacillithiol biosynthesis cysteine-adding enzyme BshC [candidate division NC10 bacterium]
MNPPRLEPVPYQVLRRLPPLFTDAIAGAIRADLLPPLPREPAALRGHLETVLRRPLPRAEVAAVLEAQNGAFEADAPALAGIAALRQPGSVAVLTGQQVGLFGGPLYTWYKALTAVIVARRWGEALGVPCVPCFWLASEDDDFAEVDHALLLRRRGGPLRVQYEPEGGFADALPATHRLTAAIGPVLAAAAEALSGEKAAAEVTALLGACYVPGATLAGAFGRLLARLLSPLGLVLVDPADPALKRLAAPALARELETAPAGSRAILAHSQALAAAGYAPQARALEDGVNLFLLEDGRRLPLTARGDGLAVRGTERVLPRRRLAALLGEAPERFSPNVFLRPLVQDSLLPTLAEVAGPAETAYLTQLRPAYALFDLPVTPLVPRASLTLVPRWAGRLLARHGLSPLDLQEERGALVTRALRRRLPPGAEERLAALRDEIAGAFGRLRGVAEEVDPTLAPVVGSAEGYVRKQLETVERKLLQAVKRRHQEVEEQIARLQDGLLPGGTPQERALALPSFLAQEGMDLLADLAAALPGPGFSHHLCWLEEG